MQDQQLSVEAVAGTRTAQVPQGYPQDKRGRRNRKLHARVTYRNTWPPA